MRLRYQKLDDRAITPKREHPTDAGLDLFALDDVVVRPGEVLTVRTGIAVMPIADYPVGLLFWDKSGRGSVGLKVLGGVIDESYRGELKVIVANVKTCSIFKMLYNIVLAKLWPKAPDFIEDNIRIPRGKAICQVLVQRIELPELEEGELDETLRGSKGFGSSDQ
jgi:dUTP pyrophosphatase